MYLLSLHSARTWDSTSFYNRQVTELCSFSGVQERSMVSLHNLQHSGFATIDYNNYM